MWCSCPWLKSRAVSGKQYSGQEPQTITFASSHSEILDKPSSPVFSIMISSDSQKASFLSLREIPFSTPRTYMVRRIIPYPPHPVHLFFPAPGVNQLRSLQQGPARRTLTRLPPAGSPVHRTRSWSWRNQTSCPASETRSCPTCCSPTAWASWRNSDDTKGPAKLTAAMADPASSVTCGFALGIGEISVMIHLL